MKRYLTVSVKLYSMLVPVLAMSLIAILITWHSLGVNSTELIRALQMKEFALRSLTLVITQSDITKSMIFDPEHGIDGKRKIEAYDANVALLHDIARSTQSAAMREAIAKLTAIDDTELQPVSTLLLEAMLAGQPKVAKALYFEKYEPARARYESLVRQLCDQADASANAAAGSLQDKNRSSMRTICATLGLGTMVVAAILLLLTRSVQKQLQVEIDERRKTMSEVATARDQALEAARVKSNFLANMSHEIRTPMNGLLGMTEVVLATNLDREQREMLEVAHRCGQGLLELLNNVLDLSKIEAGKLSHESIDFDLLEEAKRIVAIFGAQACSKGVDLKLTASANVPHYIKADPIRIRQVLTNLVGNAIKFTDAGSVALTMDLHSPKAGPAQVRLTVTDTGIGMSASTQARLFQPFTQGDNSTTRKYGGTGLGLAICKQLVESMQGAIVLRSELGKGSCFCVTIPFEESDPRQVMEKDCLQVKQQIAISGRGRPRILVAEDNAVNQMVIRRLLSQLECDSEIAASGTAALDAHKRSRFDLVLMDCQMPEMDGYAATAAIRNHERSMNLPRTPIVALTAHALEGDRERCLDSDMDDYLTKPISRNQILKVLSAWLPEQCGVPATRSSS